MLKMDQLLDDMADAADRVRSASARMKAVSPDAPEYQSEKVAYLHALVSHMSMVAIAQAKQHQDLVSAVDRLENEVKVISERFAAITRPVGVWQ
jgi:hypothetical protein